MDLEIEAPLDDLEADTDDDLDLGDGGGSGSATVAFGVAYGGAVMVKCTISCSGSA